MQSLILVLVMLACGSTMASAEILVLYAAGSLKRALGDVAKAYEKASGLILSRQAQKILGGYGFETVR